MRQRFMCQAEKKNALNHFNTVLTYVTHSNLASAYFSVP